MMPQINSLKAFLVKAAPFIAIVLGLGFVLVSGAVEYAWSGGTSGIGSRKANVAVAGLVIALVGIIFVLPITRRLLFRWVMPSIPYRYPAPVPQRIRQILLLALWFGLLLGFSDLYYLANRKFIDGSQMRFAIDIVWMAPMGGVWIAGVIGGIIALLSWRWAKLSSIRTVGFFLGVPLYWNLLLITVPAHFTGLFVLAIGLTVITVRIADHFADQFYGLVRRTTLPMIVIAIGVSAAFLIPFWLIEPRAYAALPPANADSPNVLLITMDTVRASSLSLYGYDRPTTPNLEKFAQNGVTFDLAISPSPWTLPGHGSMFTGRWPHELSSDFYDPLDDAYPTLAEVLYSNGYETAGFTANIWYGPRELGLNRGMIHYEDLAATPSEIVRSSFFVRELFHKDHLGRFTGDLPLLIRKDAQTMNGDFLNWLDGREDSNRPFFGFINYFDAHEPYYVPPPFGMQFAGKEKPLTTWKVNTDQPPEVVAELNDAYDGSIAYLDEQIGLLFGELERRGELADTLVIVTSDHGEHFGEYRILGHANSLYPQLIHVPLVVSLPSRIPAGVRVSDAVSLRDIPATVVDILDLEGGEVFPGESLVRFSDRTPGTTNSREDFLISEVTGQDWIADWYPAQKGDMKSLVGDANLYIKDADDQEEMYDLNRDPLAENNVFDSTESQSLLQKLREFVDTLPSGASLP